MKNSHWLVAMALNVALAGCQQDPLINYDPIEALHRERIATSNQPGGRSAHERADPAQESPRPEGDLTLTQVLSLVLTHSPDLQAYQLDIRVAEARELQARLLPNPEVQLEFENIAGSGQFSGVDATETTLSLAQAIPIGGDIDRRREFAEQGSEVARWDYQTTKLDVLSRATQSYIQAMAADREMALAQQELDLAKATEQITTRRVEAGDASPIESTRSVVPVITAEVNLKQAQRERAAAYRRLALMWGGKQVTFSSVTGDFDAVGSIVEPEALVQYINANPEVARWSAEVSRKIAERRLAEAEATPDLTGRLGVKHDAGNDDVALVVGVSLPITVFDRRQGDILAARLGASAAKERMRATELRIERMLSAAYSDLASARDQAIAFKDKALPAAQQAYQMTQKAFDQGELSLIDVLDAQRTLFDLERRYLDALRRFHLAATEIETLIGRPLSELDQND